MTPGLLRTEHDDVLLQYLQHHTVTANIILRPAEEGILGPLCPGLKRLGGLRTFRDSHYCVVMLLVQSLHIFI